MCKPVNVSEYSEASSKASEMKGFFSVQPFRGSLLFGDKFPYILKVVCSFSEF